VNTPTPAAAAPSAEAASAVVLPDETKFAGRRAALLISTLLLGVLSFQLNASMVTPALPQIAAEFGQGADSAAPVQSMFFLAGAIAGPVIGRWSDFIGRRAALLLVLGIMGAGTILCITAPTLPLLVTGRFLQGVSSAVFALAYIVLSENLHAKVAINGLSVLLSPKEAPAALPGINGASFGIGASLGVVLVAPFAAQATAAGYATALWISVAITAAAFIVSLFVAAPKGETV
jgi:MFS family permease